MGGEILALDEAEGTGNIRSDLSRARQRSPAAKDPDPFRKFVLRTALNSGWGGIGGQYRGSNPLRQTQRRRMFHYEK
jgi:hypothetical protein